MAGIVPVPLLALCSARMLERAVCGLEEVDLQMLKKVVRWVEPRLTRASAREVRPQYPLVLEAYRG